MVLSRFAIFSSNAGEFHETRKVVTDAPRSSSCVGGNSSAFPRSALLMATRDKARSGKICRARDQLFY